MNGGAMHDGEIAMSNFRDPPYSPDDDEPPARLPRWLDHAVVLAIAICAVAAVALR